ncbi:MAG: hypothetical protein NVSMB32_06920 [Actinomycetota bacterium]
MDEAEPGSGDQRVITHHSCITVKCAAREVARYVLDPTTMPEWSAVIYQVAAPDSGVFRQGGRLRGNMHILGVSLTVEGEMVEYDEAGMRAVIMVRPVDAEGLLEHELYVEDLQDASVLHFRNRLTLPSWVPSDVVDDDFVRHLLDQTAAFALANIRYILESPTSRRVREFMHLAGGHLSQAPCRVGPGPPQPRRRRPAPATGGLQTAPWLPKLRELHECGFLDVWNWGGL